MISAADFLHGLDDVGIRFVSGVPCSYFAEPLRRITHHPRLRYRPAANEGVALAAAAGAGLCGSRSAVIIQNSGFGNLLNPLTSLVIPYAIPVLVFMSMRGWPVPDAGEPQHRLMGQVVPSWLGSLGVRYWWLTADGPAFADIMTAAANALTAGECAFILVGNGAIEASVSSDATPADGVLRAELIRAIADELVDECVITTTGYLSRAMHNVADRNRNLYVQGSMGHVASLALGAALVRPDRRFVVVDGDGSFLMHMGALATVGHAAPANLLHVVFDNGAYESTGAQPVGAVVDFGGVARACGYREVRTVRRTVDLPVVLRWALRTEGPVLLTVTGITGGVVGARASDSLSVVELARRFQASLDPGTAASATDTA